ncbi:hypothetical protein N8865_01910 [Francisellaceae bacterium]|nr:hypothetical protein [Francisellaceae bacterium]
MKPVRRVVIAQTDNNQSAIVKDADVKNIDYFMEGVDSAVSINCWATDSAPAKISCDKDPAASPIAFLPTEKGSVLRICDIPPDSAFMHRLDEILLNGQSVTAEQKAAKHPMMHQVDAQVYGFVLTGSVKLISDTNQTILNPGDCCG